MNNERSRSICQLITVNLLIVVALLAIVELSTRALSWIRGDGFTLALHERGPTDSAITDLYSWHPFTGFTFTPGIQFDGSHPAQAEPAKVLVDEHGFLAPTLGLTAHKPDGEIRIATIGGSTTASVNLHFGENWPGLLGAQVSEALPATSVRVINAGTPGFDTSQSLANLALRVLPFEPDVVVIYHAYNDLKAIRPTKPFRPDYAHVHDKAYGHHDTGGVLGGLLQHSMFYVRMRARSAAAESQLEAIENDAARLDAVPEEAARSFERNLVSLVAIAQAAGAKVVLPTFATLHDPAQDWQVRDTYEALDPLSRTEVVSVQQFVPGLNFPATMAALGAYNEIVRRVARERGATLVDTARAVPHEPRYFLDRVHFTADGAARMAEALSPAVVSALAR